MVSDMTRIVVIDPQPAIRAGLAAMLRTEPGLVPVGAAEGAKGGIALVLHQRPDVVLLDVDCCEDQIMIVREVSDLPVMALSGKAARTNSNGRQSYYRSFGQVVSKLNEMIPQ